MVDSPLPNRVDAQTFATFLAAARRGRRDALGRLLQAYGPFLLAIARQEFDPALTGKVSPADILQETFLDAQRDFSSFQSDTNEALRRWLRHILRNNLEDCRRLFADNSKRRAGREQSIHWLTPSVGTIARADAEPLSPLSLLIQRESADRLRRAISRLPVDARRVLYLRHQLKLSYDEIGKRIDRKANAARMFHQRVIERLKAELSAVDDSDAN